MNNRTGFGLPGVLPAALLVAFLCPPTASAQKKTDVATCAEVDGALLARPASGGAWFSVKAGQKISDGTLLVALPGAVLTSGNERVKVKMLADLAKRGPLPVFESAIVLHANPKVDLDVTLDRGIMAFQHDGKKEKVEIHLRLPGGRVWEVELLEPETLAGLEIFGRYPPGTPHLVFDKQGKVVCQDRPTLDIIFVVRKGRVSIKAGNRLVTLKAPPGPALVEWDSISDQITVRRLDEPLPTILPTGPVEEKIYATICARARKVAEGSIDKGLQELRHDKEPMFRKGAATVFAALDKIPDLLGALNDPKDAELRDHTVTVLRNFIGRNPHNVERLAEVLVKEGKYSPTQAKGFVHLLYGATEQQRVQSATYELLIGLLDHSKLPIREMARWHLVRLAPAGKKIGYDAGAPEEQRKKAVKQWRELIPEGKLPPAPDAPGKQSRAPTVLENEYTRVLYCQRNLRS